MTPLQMPVPIVLYHRRDVLARRNVEAWAELRARHLGILIKAEPER